VVRKPSPDSVNRPWRHDLDHDAESVFWLLLYWVVGAQPAEREKERIISATWANLTGPVRYRTALVRSLSEEGSLEELAHSLYQPLLALLSNLAAILVVDRYWLDESETRNNEEYVPEAFQRLILQFILENRDKEFMTQPVDRQFRQVKVIGQNLSLPGTESSRWNADSSKKRPSPRPSMQRMKRPRLAEGVTEVRAVDLELCHYVCSYMILCFQDASHGGEEEVSDEEDDEDGSEYDEMDGGSE
jgi:hypothetical protein